MLPRLRRLAVFTTLCACGPGQASDEGESGTSSGTSGMTEPTGGEFDGVLVTREDMYLPAGGEPVVQPADPLGQDQDMTILAGDQTFAGTYDGAGQRGFPGVPEGAYLLRVQSQQDPDLPGAAPTLRFTATDLRVLDEGAPYSGRADLATTDAPGTAIVLNVSGMQPAQPQDSFEIYSYDADAWVMAYPGDGDGSPAEGSTAITNWKLPWDADTVLSARDLTPLVDPRQGDTLQLARLTTTPFLADAADLADPWSHAQLQRIVQSAPLTVSPMSAGGTSVATGAFTAAPLKTAKLDFRAGAFQDALAQYGDADVSCIVYLYLEPGLEVPVLGITPNLASLFIDATAPLDPACFPGESLECDPSCNGDCDSTMVPAKIPDRVLELPYANPYALGTETLGVSCTATTVVTHPFSGELDVLTAEVYAGRRLADVDGPIVPTMAAPGDLRVNGNQAPLDALTEVGLTPTISFEPPAVGEPDFYTVIVRTLEDVLDADANILSRRRTVASVRTTATSVQIPAGVLEAGSVYYVQVYAGAGVELMAPRRAYTHTVAGARGMTGMLVP